MLGSVRPSIRLSAVNQCQSILTMFEPDHLSGSPAVISDTGHRCRK